jgi:hypothetical protein
MADVTLSSPALLAPVEIVAAFQQHSARPLLHLKNNKGLPSSKSFKISPPLDKTHSFKTAT